MPLNIKLRAIKLLPKRIKILKRMFSQASQILINGTITLMFATKITHAVLLVNQ